MKHSELLAIAKNHLDPLINNNCNSSIFICIALELAANKIDPDWRDDDTSNPIQKIVNEIQTHINNLLEGLPVLSYWLTTYYPEWLSTPAKERVQKLYETRLAWIDNMIEYYKSQGK